MKPSKLPRQFYLRPTITVARDLLGKYLCRKRGKSYLAARIVEVEAYLGSRDPASHAFGGKTPRNEVMFSRGGYLYVYFTYGMHFCANVVTGKEGKAFAVLLRALEPVTGIGTMERRRGGKKGNRRPGPTDIVNLCNGPAKLCEAFGIGRKENGEDLCGPRIWIARDQTSTQRPAIRRSRRIGIRKGRNHLWRFFIPDNQFVSRGKPSDPESSA